jgi:hypothetical protein
MGGNAARIEIKRMGSGLRDGFGPPAAPWLAFPAPFRRRSMSRSGVTSRSALPHSGPSRLGVAFKAKETNEYSNPRYLEFWDRQIEDLRKARMPED